VPGWRLTGIHPDSKIVYRRYASLFFIAGCASTDNELITLEIVHRYVEQMDKYYGNVCELDIIFNFQKAYFILDELLLAGEMQESSKKNVLRVISAQDSIEDTEVSEAWSFDSFGCLPSKMSMEEVPLGDSHNFSCTDTNNPQPRSTRKSRKSCESRPFIHVYRKIWSLAFAGFWRLSIAHITGLQLIFLLSFANDVFYDSRKMQKC
jgi:hypothetical protein